MYRLYANDIKIVEGCKAAFIYKWIICYNAGYNTVVGEGGIKLLGGKR